MGNKGPSRSRALANFVGVQVDLVVHLVEPLLPMVDTGKRTSGHATCQKHQRPRAAAVAAAAEAVGAAAEAVAAAEAAAEAAAAAVEAAAEAAT
jgi:hypothetical protein